jgi:membrane fusion protein (multidrug efflux system)
MAENQSEMAPPSKPGAKPHPFRRALIIVAVVVAAAALVAGGRWFAEYLSTVTTNNATIQADIVSLSFQVGGTIQSILVADNERVEAGQALLQLDTRDYDIALAQAEAALELARRQASAAEANVNTTTTQSGAAELQAQGAVSSAGAGVAVAQADVEAAQSALASSRAKLAQAEAQLELAERELKRTQRLADEGVVATQQLDETETRYKVAKAAVEAARMDAAAQETRLEQAKQRVQVAEAQRTQSKGTVQTAAAARDQAVAQRKQYEASLAQVAVAEKNVEKARQQLAYTSLRAPASGLVGDRGVDVGQLISPGQPLMALVKDNLWLVANFKETQMKRIKPGLPVDVTVDAYPGKVFKARVDSVSPASGSMFALLPPENASGNFTKVVQRISVKIVFEPEALEGYEGLLRPGMSVTAKVRIR